MKMFRCQKKKQFLDTNFAEMAMWMGTARTRNKLKWTVRSWNAWKQGAGLSRELLLECDRRSWQRQVSFTFCILLVTPSLISRIHTQNVGYHYGYSHYWCCSSTQLNVTTAVPFLFNSLTVILKYLYLVTFPTSSYQNCKKAH